MKEKFCAFCGIRNLWESVHKSQHTNEEQGETITDKCMH